MFSSENRVKIDVKQFTRYKIKKKSTFVTNMFYFCSLLNIKTLKKGQF